MKRVWLAVTCGMALGIGGGLAMPSTAAACDLDGCCKHCTIGKACGNTCISMDKTCHVGPGCACDGPTPRRY